jgi:hypothetical protein
VCGGSTFGFNPPLLHSHPSRLFLAGPLRRLSHMLAGQRKSLMHRLEAQECGTCIPIEGNSVGAFPLFDHQMTGVLAICVFLPVGGFCPKQRVVEKFRPPVVEPNMIHKCI